MLLNFKQISILVCGAYSSRYGAGFREGVAQFETNHTELSFGPIFKAAQIIRKAFERTAAIEIV